VSARYQKFRGVKASKNGSCPGFGIKARKARVCGVKAGEGHELKKKGAYLYPKLNSGRGTNLRDKI